MTREIIASLVAKELPPADAVEKLVLPSLVDAVVIFIASSFS